MHIGEAARRTGLSVRTVRYYSDLGLVPEAARTASGYRRYDGGAVVRLEYVRTLRELGLDLATIRRVLDREAELPAVAAAHAEAIGAQIRLLRLQRAALRALSRRSWTPEELEHVNRLAHATADERRRIIDEFLDSIFAGVHVSPDFDAMMRRAVPEVPDDPTDEQVDAWIELVELVRDTDFRDRLRAMGRHSFGASDGSEPAPPALPSQTPRNLGTTALERAGAALSAGVDPAAAEADTLHDQLVSAYAEAAEREPDETYRRELLDLVQLSYEPRAERYWQLIAIINRWPPIPPAMPAWGWFRDALRARLT